MIALPLPLASVLAWRPRSLAGLDVPLLLAALALVSIGVVMIASASIGFTAVAGDSFYLLLRHLAFLSISAAVAFVIVQIPVSVWYRYSGWLLLAALFLLLMVLIPGIGRSVNGARRWIGFGGVSLQISELAKLALIIFIAAYLQRNQVRLREQWQGFARPMGILAVVVGLLIAEPDFGSSVVISATVLGMLFLAGVRLWQFVALLATGIAGLGLLVIVAPYRMQRWQTFLDPWAEQYKGGYQLTQSLIAFGRGEWTGVGLGNSVQKLSYLPEAHT
ncbi:MAG: FtsW/RodA/SpoVE family cell cycle protein, partial [Porticoccaceae bacterium]